MTQMNTDHKIWKRRAMAFAVRAHNHLWGKNNEDPLVFLYRQGLSHDFSRRMYLGWNKFGQDRHYERWGIDKPGNFYIPPGIVFPYIIDKTLTALFIIPMEQSQDVFRFPGNPDASVTLGNREKKATRVTDMLQGLVLFATDPDGQCIDIQV